MNNRNILESTDITPYESPVIILSDGRVIYHQEVPGNDSADDPVWIVGYKDEWQRDFDDLDHESVVKLESYCGEWDGMATAGNICTYIQYFGHSRSMHEPDWKWSDFSGSIINVYDEHTYHEGDTEDDEDYLVECENCHKIIDPDEAYEVPETKNFNEVTVCRKCLDDVDMEEHFGELEKERISSGTI